MVKTKHKIHDLTPIFFLVAVTIAFFGKAIYSGKTLYGSDFLFYFYP